MSVHFQGPVLVGRVGHPFNHVPVQVGGLVGHASGFVEDFVVWGGPTGDVSTTPVITGGWRANRSVGGTHNIGRPTDLTHGGIVMTLPASQDEAVLTLEVLGEAFRYTVGKRLWYATRLKVSNVAATDLLCGLVVQASPTVPVANSAENSTDGIYWFRAAPDTTATGRVRKSGTSTTASGTYTMADDTYAILAIHVDDVGNVEFWSGTTLDNLTRTGVVARGNANIPNTVQLNPVIAVGVEGTTSRTATVDWVLAALER